eukprot:scaffold6386_cov229-Pinguiococcus_pyrenoidosus.AAC.2
MIIGSRVPDFFSRGLFKSALLRSPVALLRCLLGKNGKVGEEDDRENIRMIRKPARGELPKADGK